MKFEDIMDFLENNKDLNSVKGMASVGIKPKSAYGIRIPVLRKLAKQIGRNHMLANELWAKDTRETRILACMIADYRTMPETQLDSWVREFDYWEICDQCIMNLAEKVPFSYRKAVEWARADEEYVRRAGYVLMARLAVSDKKAQDQKFLNFLPTIEQGLDDERHQVKLAVSWALRQIGKRNISLNSVILNEVKKFGAKNSKSRDWIIKDVIRDITRDSVQVRLKKKKKKKKKTMKS